MKPAHPPKLAPSPSTTQGANQLRIIGGSWRGRKLCFPSVDGLRPTGDRLRETLFNWLQPEIQQARCLDLFAGSGALGVESLSRGAAQVTFIEAHTQAANQLVQNLALLKADNAQVLRTDALQWLQQGNKSEPYHIVFMDPPFALNLWQSVIDALEAGNWLAEDATIYIESPYIQSSYNIQSSRDSLLFQPPINWQLHRDKHAGQVSYRLYYREANIV